jgi:hypothetical protein
MCASSVTAAHMSGSSRNVAGAANVVPEPPAIATVVN